MTPPPLLPDHAKHGKFAKQTDSAKMPNCDKRGGGVDWNVKRPLRTPVNAQVKFPPWIIDEVRKSKRELHHLNSLNTAKDIKRFNLHTVCDEALCPNKGKCFSDGAATFLILGDICTRKCKFCAVEKNKKPESVNSSETKDIATLSKKWNLKYVVFTSPTRDDLNDGGAAQFAQTIIEIKKISKDIKTEPLIPDFGGNIKSLETVLKTKPDVLAHNIETVPSLYESVRIGSNYKKSLKVLKNSKKIAPEIFTKSGLMLGLG
ncbi:MAG: lipoyl synthase, partial [Elusimicrobiota bacterium]|nr:lipoyl synthase [Elusimicrobiota bacterium]